jgi:hypothetical protein
VASAGYATLVFLTSFKSTKDGGTVLEDGLGILRAHEYVIGAEPGSDTFSSGATVTSEETPIGGEEDSFVRPSTLLMACKVAGPFVKALCQLSLLLSLLLKAGKLTQRSSPERKRTLRSSGAL